MKCPNCGCEIFDEKFCPLCGTPLIADNPDEAEKIRNNINSDDNRPLNAQSDQRNDFVVPSYQNQPFEDNIVTGLPYNESSKAPQTAAPTTVAKAPTDAKKSNAASLVIALIVLLIAGTGAVLAIVSSINYNKPFLEAYVPATEDELENYENGFKEYKSDKPLNVGEAFDCKEGTVKLVSVESNDENIKTKTDTVYTFTYEYTNTTDSSVSLSPSSQVIDATTLDYLSDFDLYKTTNYIDNKEVELEDSYFSEVKPNQTVRVVEEYIAPKEHEAVNYTFWMYIDSDDSASLISASYRALEETEKAENQ